MIHPDSAAASLVISPPDFSVPAGACDSHVHIFDPENYSYRPDRSATPATANLAQLSTMLGIIGMQRVVIVQPIVYGTNNSCVVDSVVQLGSRARGVAVIDENTSGKDLEALWSSGIRGVRIVELADTDKASKRIAGAANILAGTQFHIQFLGGIATFPALRNQLKALRQTLVIDHFGYPNGARGLDQPGIADLLGLVADGAYIKQSAMYRLTVRDKDFAGLVPLARALVRAGPDRIVWGTDWPHYNSHRPPGTPESDPHPTIPYIKVDTGRELNTLARIWKEEGSSIRKVLVDNPAKLYGFPAN